MLMSFYLCVYLQGSSIFFPELCPWMWMQCHCQISCLCFFVCLHVSNKVGFRRRRRRRRRRKESLMKLKCETSAVTDFDKKTAGKISSCLLVCGLYYADSTAITDLEINKKISSKQRKPRIMTRKGEEREREREREEGDRQVINWGERERKRWRERWREKRKSWRGERQKPGEFDK